MPTQIAPGSAAANKIFNAALFARVTRQNSFTNLLVDNAPKTIDSAKVDPSKQTPAGAPIVRVYDLAKSKGEEVTMDLFHDLGGLPTMGDRKLAGRGESLTQSQFTAKINQGRHMVDSGGKMTQQRTMQDLKRIASTLLGPYFNKLQDEITTIHLAGARGVETKGWTVPLASHPEFADILVNTVTPPTYDCHFYGGDATSIDTIDSTDKFSLASVDFIRLKMDEADYPLQPVKFEGDQASDDNPFLVHWITPRQWYDFKQTTSAKDLATMQSNALQRASMFKHPIFTGECFLWNNILVRKMSRAIQFNAGTNVTVCTNSDSAATTTVTAGVKIHRSLIMGAQALADMYGMSGKASSGGYHFSTHTESTDHENAMEHSIAWMNGKAKIRFKDQNGRVNDHGVWVMDTAASS